MRFLYNALPKSSNFSRYESKVLWWSRFVPICLVLIALSTPAYASHSEFPKGIRARAVAGKVVKVGLTPLRVLRGLLGGCAGCG